MVQIPAYGDPTLRELERAVEREQRDEERRQYLGASMIGDPCARKIWYEYNNYPRDEISHIGLMAAQSGYFAEEITAKRLQSIEGIELITHNRHNKQIGFSAFDGKFKGHVDGLITGLLQAPKRQHIWEHKDKDHKKFNEFKNTKEKFGEKNALENWNIIYFAQAQIYMHFLQCDRHYMTVSYAGGRKYESCRTEYQPEKAAQYIERAEKILNATQEPPRISDKRDFFMCRWCQFKDICHG